LTNGKIEVWGAAAESGRCALGHRQEGLPERGRLSVNPERLQIEGAAVMGLTLARYA